MAYGFIERSAMRRQVIAEKSEGVRTGDLITAVATSGIALNVGSQDHGEDTVFLTFSHCAPSLRRDDLMHLQLRIKVPSTQSVEEVFNTVRHYIGGRWNRENPKGSFAGANNFEPGTFGCSQILSDFIPAKHAWTYLTVIKETLPQYKSDLFRTQFALRRKLAATFLGKLKHEFCGSDELAKQWISCLRDAGLSEHQIGQWSTLLTETSNRYNPADPNSSLKRSIQDAANFLMSRGDKRDLQEAWHTQTWDINAVHGSKNIAFLCDARSVEELKSRLSLFKEAKLEEPPYKESFLDVVKSELLTKGMPLALLAATAATVYSATQPKPALEVPMLTHVESIGHPLSRGTWGCAPQLSEVERVLNLYCGANPSECDPDFKPFEPRPCRVEDMFGKPLPGFDD